LTDSGYWPDRRSLVSRPSKAELDRLAAEIAVERLVEERGIALSGEDTVKVGACPWCDTVAGLTVDREANTFSCSGCDAGGGPVEWVLAIEACRLLTRSSFCVRGCR